MGQIGRFICPQCHAVNVQDGNCFKCGADLMPREGDGDDQPQQQPRTQWQGEESGRHLRSMQSGPGLTKRQMIMLGVVALLGVAMLMMMMPSSSPPPPATDTGPDAANAPPPAAVAAAIALAEKFAGFKDTPPQGWQFEDTAKDTTGMPSFGMSSQQANTKVTFVVWDNTGPVENLDIVLTKVPFTDFFTVDRVKEIQVSKGDGFVGKDAFPWYAGRFTHQKENKMTMCLVGAYKSPVPGKAIVFVSLPLDETKDQQKLPGNQPGPTIAMFDYKTTLWLIDTMAAEYTAKVRGLDVPGATTGEDTSAQPAATAAELDGYRKQVEGAIKAKFKPVEDDSVEEPKVVVSFAIGSDGKISKLEIAESSHSEKIDQSLVKAITSNQPYSKPPQTASGSVALLATADGADLKVELQD